ncbi:HNH endonuclease [Streptomyces sp. ISL-10]|uniref:HNH endonuclease signature motif containing protein n=1 Tax=Streptomyces sp. ISL-10 TaxID=2819172 RepID=UPI001BEC72EE|nr:HNH endonuclease [Streptomyces sp. ISL-10]
MAIKCAVLSEYPGYVISADGRIQGRRGKWLSATPGNKRGHLQVTLSLGTRKVQAAVHRLVALAFLGDPPTSKHEVRHLNGDPTDNRAENLAWGTRAENAADSVRHGTHYGASRTHCLRDHEYTEANTYRVPNSNKRQCRKCQRIRAGGIA